MTDLAIRVEHLSKRYEIGAQEAGYLTIRDQLVQLVKNLATPFKQRPKNPEIWALNDVSFDVRKGEVVGIIGRNGAGKSTLLKLLSQITEPTRGRYLTYGRIGSLLEVGTGFHPELTGRDNIYLNGAILGMTRAEIKAKFDEIVDFSGVEKFIDTPVKRYSSGMGLRLGFAVAAHLEPEILIVDEVLAVGDAEFQKKCLGKMSDVANEGRTVLFVSHNMAAVKSLCPRSIILSSGEIIRDGPTSEIVPEYLQSVPTKLESRWDEIESAPGNDKVRLHSVSITADEEADITLSKPIQLNFSYWNKIPDTVLNISVLLRTLDQVLVFNIWSQPQAMPAGLIKHTCQIPEHLLNNITYSVDIMLVENHSEVLFKISDLITFEPIDDRIRETAWFGQRQGAIAPDIPITTEFAVVS